MARGKQVNIRLDEDERQVLQQAADLQEQPLATFVRLAAIDQAHQLLEPEAGESPTRLPAWLLAILIFLKSGGSYHAPGAGPQPPAGTPAPRENFY